MKYLIQMLTAVNYTQRYLAKEEKWGLLKFSRRQFLIKQTFDHAINMSVYIILRKHNLPYPGESVTAPISRGSKILSMVDTAV